MPVVEEEKEEIRGQMEVVDHVELSQVQLDVVVTLVALVVTIVLAHLVGDAVNVNVHVGSVGAQDAKNVIKPEIARKIIPSVVAVEVLVVPVEPEEVITILVDQLLVLEVPVAVVEEVVVEIKH